MQNDERDERREPEDPDREVREERDEDEFETAAWPQRDTLNPSRGEPHHPEEPSFGEVEERATERDDEEVADATVEASDEAAREPIRDPAWEAPGEPEPPPSEAEAVPPPVQETEPVVPAHSVPATEPGESTRCPRCGTENRPGISFCRSCGQRLVAAGAPATVARPTPPEGTQACPRCGTHNRAGVAFCQNCGANLRPAAEGYVPPAVAEEEPAAAPAEEAAGRALLGPIVLLIGAIGIATAWVLPFAIGDASLYDQSFGTADGYGIAFWTAYDQVSGLAQQAYFGFAAPAPLLVLLLVGLAIGGFVRRAPGVLQLTGLVIALVWAIGLAALFVVVEILGGPGGEMLDILRSLSPGGIIFLLAGLIVVIGTLTRIARG